MALVKGIQDNPVLANAKHYALNHQESFRNEHEGPGSWGIQKNLLGGFMPYVVAQDVNADPIAIDPEKYLPRLDYLSSLLDAVDPADGHK